MLLRLVYFDFQFFNIALPLAESIRAAIPMSFDLEATKAQLKVTQRNYRIEASISPSITQAGEMLQKLEEMLGETYQIRQYFERYFEILLILNFIHR